MRENTAYLYGQLTRDPICYKNPSTQELLSGQITIKTARRTNATGELFVKGRLRIDFITIYSRNEKLIREQFMSLRYGDWEKGLKEHISRFKFLNSMLKEAKSNMEDLIKEGEQL